MCALFSCNRSVFGGGVGRGIFGRAKMLASMLSYINILADKKRDEMGMGCWWMLVIAVFGGESEGKLNGMCTV